MNNYDSMTVDDLMSEYVHWARNEAGTHWEIRGTQGVVVDDENPLNVVARKHAIIAALRRKVIEEASVKTIEVSGDESKEWLHIEGGILPDGIYDLIPKETP